MKNINLNNQEEYWEINYANKPKMFGLAPSFAAEEALKIFKKKNISSIVELGAGLGRDTIYFAKNNIKVEALDYSKTAVTSIKKKVKELNLSEFVSTKVFDVRKKLPFKNNSIQGIFSHMLYCMSLKNLEVQNLNSEILRVLVKGGVNIYTVRNFEDGDYKNGLHIEDESYQNDGFIINFFSKKKIEELLVGFINIKIDRFNEGDFPRKLFIVQNQKK
ncbi:class I SAM-dependent methyltransferase [Pelagibacteraceae bacterium]|nr:class I SAM-dependent methyltransferase [Pelagibacteraceae bacterium]MDC0858628.1 class I SAM-dependent methyltransferase [Pelagibacteraceae bacterium]